jgi:hypothetical protein
MLGVLQVKFEEAKLTNNTELWGKMDIYLKLKHRDIVQQSTVFDNAGKTFKWEEPPTFEFKINEPLEQIELEVLDKDLLTSDTVGTTILQVEDISVNGGINDWIEIHFGKK